MNKISGWALAIYVLTITDVAAFEFAYILHQNFIIRLLVGGVGN